MTSKLILNPLVIIERNLTMAESISIEIKLDNGVTQSLTATTHFIDDGDGIAPNGVYDLTSDSLSDDLGQIAFHLDNPHEWVYTGTILSIEEEEQVAEQILKHADSI